MTIDRAQTSVARGVGLFLAGIAIAAFLLATQALEVGGASALLAVGEESDLRTVIETEIPGLIPVSGEGNDAQIYYAIALDLRGEELTSFVPQAPLRWRRLLQPALVSFGGLLRGEALLWSFVAWSALALGACAAALDRIAGSLGLSRWALLALFANPGVWLAVRMLTPDIMALALALMGLAAALEHRDTAAILLLAMAPLAKEPYLLVALGIAGWLWFAAERRRAALYGGIPGVVFGLWTLVMSAVVPGGVVESGNLAAPFVGIARASSWWPSIDPRQNVLTAIALGMVLFGTLAALLARRRHLLGWLIWPWVALALVTSEWVWRFGNGSLRGFAPIGIFGGLAVAAFLSDRRARIAPA